MELLYPDAGGTVLLPVLLDGSVGNMVAEAAHRDADAVLYWDLDGRFIGTTTGVHRMAFSPAAGSHRLTLTDQRGGQVPCAFTVIRASQRP